MSSLSLQISGFSPRELVHSYIPWSEEDEIVEDRHGQFEADQNFSMRTGTGMGLQPDALAPSQWSSMRKHSLRGYSLQGSSWTLALNSVQ